MAKSNRDLVVCDRHRALGYFDTTCVECHNMNTSVWVDEAAQIPDAAWKDIQRAVENPVTVAQKGVVSET